METKVCPFMSGKGLEADCVMEACMLYRQGKQGGCDMVLGADKVAGRIDTLSAQLQEMQIALIEIMNSEKKQALSSETVNAQLQEMQIALNMILNDVEK